LSRLGGYKILSILRIMTNGMRWLLIRRRVMSLKTKLKKVYLKLLKVQCKRKWDKARDLHAKIIGLELELRVLERNKNNS